MKVVIAADSFKGSCSAEQVVTTIEKGIRHVFSDADIIRIPVADGGEGTVNALLTSVGGQRVCLTVHDPLGRSIRAEYGLLPDGTAVIETAAASGLPLLQKDERDALHASSYGTGELMRHALKSGAHRLILGLGGSATTDGGMGLVQALGVSFLDENGMELHSGGIELERLARIDTSQIMPEAKKCEFILACDVCNPLTGPTGAAAVFGPQKGASPEQVEALEHALSHYSEILSQQMDCHAAWENGAGAAGGIGCAMLAFFHASMRSGIDLVLDAAGFDEAVIGADVVITGEGRLDAQSACGKVPVGVARRTKTAGSIPVIAIGGAVADDADVLYEYGIDSIVSTVSKITTLEDALSNAAKALEVCAMRAMQLLCIGTKIKEESKK